MAIIKTDDAHYKNIGAKIREKTGGAETYKPSGMPSGIDAVYEAGKEVGQGEMWDMAQNFGARTNFAYAFSYWGVNYIRPKHKVIPTDVASRNNTFYRLNYQTDRAAKIEKAYFDFSQCPRGTSHQQGWYYTFSAGRITEIEDIGMTNAYCFVNTFAYCFVLHTIECIYPDENTLFISAFVDCKELVNLKVNGVIGQNGFDVHWSTKLSKDSIISIVNALSTTTTGLTVTLSRTAVNNAFTNGSQSDEWLALVATRSNWTIALA